MICLDANFLIGGVTESRPESRQLLAWFEAGETLCTAAPAWYVFLCGPVEPSQIKTMLAFLTGGIVAFGHEQVVTAARLFNAVERSRRLRVDAIPPTLSSSLRTVSHRTIIDNSIVQHGRKSDERGADRHAAIENRAPNFPAPLPGVPEKGVKSYLCPSKAYDSPEAIQVSSILLCMP